MNRLFRSFNHAFNGIVNATRTQPNMRTHVIVAVLVLLTALLLRLDRYYIVALIVVIALVLGLELVNTALEAIVDMFTEVHHPLAKTAKDAAAGAVLVAAIAAAVVGYLIFYAGLRSGGQRVFAALQAVPSNTALIVLAVVALLTIFAKAWVGRGTPLRGGAVSGHAALAFALATLLAAFYQQPLAAVLGYVLAFLVAESRVESKVHTFVETLAGAVLGSVVALAVYVLVRPHVVL